MHLNYLHKILFSVIFEYRLIINKLLCPLTINSLTIVQKMRKMCKKNRRVGKKQIAIVLTDGLSNIDNHRTVKEAQLAKDDDIEIIVIGSYNYIILRYHYK